MLEGQKIDSRRKILQAAIAEFGEKGYEAASTNHICRQAEISKGLLFHYFKSKRTLFAEALEQCLRDVESATEGPCAQDGAAPGCMQEFFWLRMDFFAAHVHHFMILEEIFSNGTEASLPEVQPLRRRVDAIRSGRYRSFLDKHRLRPGISRETALDLLLGASESIQRKCLRRIHLLGEPAEQVLEDFREEYRMALSMLFYGMLAPTGCAGREELNAEGRN